MRNKWFGSNNQIGKTEAELRAELAEHSAEFRKRQNNGVDTEDQEWAIKNTRDALGRLN